MDPVMDPVSWIPVWIRFYGSRLDISWIRHGSGFFERKVQTLGSPDFFVQKVIIRVFIVCLYPVLFCIVFNIHPTFHLSFYPSCRVDIFSKTESLCVSTSRESSSHYTTVSGHDSGTTTPSNAYNDFNAPVHDTPVLESPRPRS